MSYRGRVLLDRERVSLGGLERIAERNAVVGTTRIVSPRTDVEVKEIGIVKVSVHTLRHNPRVYGIRGNTGLEISGTADAARPHQPGL